MFAGDSFLHVSKSGNFSTLRENRYLKQMFSKSLQSFNMNGEDSPLEKRGVRKSRERVMRTEHRDQHLNSRLLAPWVPHGWSKSQNTRGCRDLPWLPSFAENQDLCPACQPSPSSGHLVPSYQVPITVIRRVGESF